MRLSAATVRRMGGIEDHWEQEPDPEDELRERLDRVAEHGVRESNLAIVLETVVAGTGWRVARHQVVRSSEIAATYEVVVLHDSTPHAGPGGPLWALIAFSIVQPFADMSSEQRAVWLENVLLEVGTADQLVPWLMPPDLSFSHLPPGHPIHKRPLDAGPALWKAHPLLGWNRLRELSSLAVLLETLRDTEPEQADALELLVARHPQGTVVSEYRRAISADR